VAQLAETAAPVASAAARPEANTDCTGDAGKRQGGHRLRQECREKIRGTLALSL